MVLNILPIEFHIAIMTYLLANCRPEGLVSQDHFCLLTLFVVGWKRIVTYLCIADVTSLHRLCWQTSKSPCSWLFIWSWWFWPFLQKLIAAYTSLVCWIILKSTAYAPYELYLLFLWSLDLHFELLTTHHAYPFLLFVDKRTVFADILILFGFFDGLL